MNPQLTCSQCQWLHSSVGRASHLYREVTGSNPVEVLDFFQASLRNCINCVHCDDHFFIFTFVFCCHYVCRASSVENVCNETSRQVTTDLMSMKNHVLAKQNRSSRQSRRVVTANKIARAL